MSGKGAAPPAQRATIGQVVSRPENRWAVKMLLLTTAAMFIMPCLTFYVVFNLPFFDQEDRSVRTTWAGVAAIVMVQVVVGVWICISWSEEKTESWNRPSSDGEKKSK